MKKSTARKYKNISMFCFIFFVFCAIINIAINIVSIVNNPTTSFPWYSPIVLVGAYYAIPLTVILAAYLFFMLREKKTKE